MTSGTPMVTVIDPKYDDSYHDAHTIFSCIHLTVKFEAVSWTFWVLDLSTHHKAICKGYS